MIRVKHKGGFDKTERSLKRMLGANLRKTLERYGQAGVDALMAATPIDTGLTAASWYYTITDVGGKLQINFCNSNINDGVPIAVILQYGHGTGTGGWVEGVDYINPALRPVFDKIASEAWEEVSK